MFNKNKSKPEKKKESFADQVKLFFSTYLLALLIRTLLIEASQIPSQSMVPSLQVGDILMVEKVSLGAYIPVLNGKFPGLSKPKVNDMVVFVSPEWKSPGFMDELITFLSLSIINKDNTFANPKILVKRIVAGPGDILTMTNQQLYHNGTMLSDKSFASQNQIIYSGGKRQGRLNYNLFEEKDESYKRVVQHAIDTQSSETNTIVIYDRNDFEEYLRPLLVQGFPPITIPQKGVEIMVNDLNNYEKYLLAKLITRENKDPLIKGAFMRDSKIIMHSKDSSEQEVTTWTPADNYYFMMGDNRDFSEDGRYFGYVPQERVYGRVLFRYWPFNRISLGANLKQENAK